MELNEAEKRQLFQIDGDCQTKVLDELYMTARLTRNPEQRDIRFYKAYNMEFEDKRTAVFRVRLPADSAGGRTQRVPDARLGVPVYGLNYVLCFFSNHQSNHLLTMMVRLVRVVT